MYYPKMIFFCFWGVFLIFLQMQRPFPMGILGNIREHSTHSQNTHHDLELYTLIRQKSPKQITIPSWEPLGLTMKGQ